MKLTQQQRLMMALKSRGATFVRATAKYIVMTTTRPSSPERYYLGKAGSLRVGFSRTNSRPVSDRLKSDLLNQYPATLPKVGTYKHVIEVTL